MRRRSLLATVGSAVALGGCLSAGSSEGCAATGVPQGGLRLLNADETERAVELTAFLDLLVVRDIVFEETVQLPGRNAAADRHTLVEDVVDSAGRHVLRVRVRDTGETTDFLWDVSASGCNGLVVSVNDGTASVSAVDPDGSRGGGGSRS